MEFQNAKIIKSMGSLNNLTVSNFLSLGCTSIESIFDTFILSLKNRKKLIRNTNKDNFLSDITYRWLTIVLQNLYDFKHEHNLRSNNIPCDTELTEYINNLKDPLTLIQHFIDMYDPANGNSDKNIISKQDYINLYGKCVGKKVKPRTDTCPKNSRRNTITHETIPETRRIENPETKRIENKDTKSIDFPAKIHEKNDNNTRDYDPETKKMPDIKKEADAKDRIIANKNIPKKPCEFKPQLKSNIKNNVKTYRPPSCNVFPDTDYKLPGKRIDGTSFKPIR